MTTNKINKILNKDNDLSENLKNKMIGSLEIIDYLTEKLYPEHLKLLNISNTFDKISHSNVYGTVLNKNAAEINNKFLKNNVEMKIESNYLSKFYNSTKTFDKLFEDNIDKYENTEFLNLYSAKLTIEDETLHYLIPSYDLYESNLTEESIIKRSTNLISNKLDQINPVLNQELLNKLKENDKSIELFQIERIKENKTGDFSITFKNEKGEKIKKNYMILNNDVFPINSDFIISIKETIKNIQVKTNIKNLLSVLGMRQEKGFRNFTSNNLDICGVVLSVISKNLSNFNAETSSSPAGPDSSKFRAIHYGNIENTFNEWKPRKDYYSFPTFIPVGVKTGSNISKENNNVLHNFISLVVDELNKNKNEELRLSNSYGSAYSTTYIQKKDNQTSSSEGAPAIDCFGYNNDKYISFLKKVITNVSNSISNNKRETMKEQIVELLKDFNKNILGKKLSIDKEEIKHENVKTKGLSK